MKQATEVSLGNLTILVLNTRPDLLFSVKKATKKKKKKKKKKTKNPTYENCGKKMFTRIFKYLFEREQKIII